MSIHINRKVCKCFLFFFWGGHERLVPTEVRLYQFTVMLFFCSAAYCVFLIRSARTRICSSHHHISFHWFNFGWWRGPWTFYSSCCCLKRSQGFMYSHIYFIPFSEFLSVRDDFFRKINAVIVVILPLVDIKCYCGGKVGVAYRVFLT